MIENLDEVIASYHRCRRSEGFVDTFYADFLGRSPSIAEMFAGTNFKIQKLMLRESLLEMLCFEQGMPGAREEIEQLGRKHEALQVTPEMYEMWLDSLCVAIERHDPEYTPQLANLWREAMQKGIAVMLAAGKSSPSDD